MAVHKEIWDVGQALTVGNILDDAIAHKSILGGLELLIVLDILIGEITADVKGIEIRIA